MPRDCFEEKRDKFLPLVTLEHVDGQYIYMHVRFLLQENCELSTLTIKGVSKTLCEGSCHCSSVQLEVAVLCSIVPKKKTVKAGFIIAWLEKHYRRFMEYDNSLVLLVLFLTSTIKSEDCSCNVY